MMYKILMGILLLTLTLVSCQEKDPCDEINCNSNSTCFEGSCVCKDGWLEDSSSNCTVQDLCFNVTCGMHGICDASNGNCICDLGYEKDGDALCNIPIRDQFIGIWQGSHVYQGISSGVYQFEIEATPEDPIAMRVINFMDLECPSTAGSDLTAIVTHNNFGLRFSFNSDCSDFQILDTTMDLNGQDVLEISSIIHGYGQATSPYQGTYERQ